MTAESNFQLIAFRDERLARHATGAQPAWLWSTDGLRILWSNPVAADIFGARNGAELCRAVRSPADALGRRVAKLGRSLAADGSIHLEKMTGFGAALGGLMTCACAHLRFENNPDGILIVGLDPPLIRMPLDERLKRLVEGIATPLAIFSKDGQLVATTPSAGELSAGAKTLADFDASLQRVAVGAGRDLALVAFLGPDMTLVKDPLDEKGNEEGQSEIPPAEANAPAATEQTSLDQPLMTAPDHDSSTDYADLSGDDALFDAVPDETVASAWQESAPVPEPKQHSQPNVATDTSDRAADPQTPLRFVWQTDADNRFTLNGGEFERLLAQPLLRRLGDPWSDLAAAFNLDPDGKIAQALGAHQTWGGLVANWPSCHNDLRIVAEMSGIPIYDAERSFAGFRGFGICRDRGVLDQILAGGVEPEMIPEPDPEPSGAMKDSMDDTMDNEPPSNATAGANDAEVEPVISEPAENMLSEDSHEESHNVVPFRPLGEQQKPPVLTPVENNAFNEIARQLSARLEGKAANDEPLASTIASQDTLHDTPHDTSQETSQDIFEDETESATPESRGDDYQQPPSTAQQHTRLRASALHEKTLLERFPFGILVYRLDRLLFANRAFLERTGFATIHQLSEAGGLDALYVEPGVSADSSSSESGTFLKVAATEADPTPSDARLMTISWDDEPALALVLLPQGSSPPAPVAASPEAAAPHPEPPRPAEPPAAPPPETEFAQAKREATRTAAARADLLARISHDIRAPLSTITGFADVMIEQRFGPLGNERYVDYMKDIRASSERIVAIINDLLDLSQIESGQVALAFTANNLNQVVEQCVAGMQAQANRERVIIRSSLAKGLPPVMADARTLRQIATTLIAGTVRMSRSGAQIIVSTALDDDGAVALRMRDATHVMTEKDINTVMDPLGSGPREDSDGAAAFNLSVTRALVAANRAKLNIRSAAQSGTLIEVIFPSNDSRISQAN